MTEKTGYLKTIARICRAIGASSLNRGELLHLITQSTVEAMQAKAACFFLSAEGKEPYVAVARTGLSKDYPPGGPGDIVNILPIMLKEGYLYYRDATTDPRLQGHAAMKAEGIGSILAVPVMVKGRLIGQLSLYTANIRRFSAKESEFLTIMAEHGGMVIELAGVVEKLRENTTLFLNLGISITSSLDIKTILQTLTAEVAKTIGVRAASIRLLDDDRATLRLVASYGLSEKYLSKGPIYSEKSIAEALEGKPVVVKDAAIDKGVQYKDEKQEEGIVSILCVPIKSKEEVIGVLRLYSAAPREFTEDEIMLVTALAYAGGVAIQNASLYLMLTQDIKDLKDDAWSHRCWF